MQRKYRAYYYLIHTFTYTPDKNPCVISPLMSTVNTPTIQNIPPIIHYILSIILHTSTHHNIKTHNNSQKSPDNHIFVTPRLVWANLNMKHFPLQHGGSQGGGNVIQ